MLALAGVAFAALVVAAAPADARPLKRPSPKVQHQTAKDGATPIKGPLIIAISIGSQRLTVFDDGVPVASSPVSTGTASHPTPMGVFSVIQKNRFHRSNIYSGAPMPFMQRITWSGVALHAGVLPGYPASHGCIRLPHDFAARLWGMTRIGARVIITRHEVTPFAFEHLRLSVLTAGPDGGASRSGGLRPSMEDGTTGRRVRTADASDATSTGVTDAAGLALLVAPGPAKDVPAASAEVPKADLSVAAEAPARTGEPPHVAGTAAAEASVSEVRAREPDAGQAEASAAPDTAATPAPSGIAAASEPVAAHAVDTTAGVNPPMLAPALPAVGETVVVERATVSPAALPIDEVFIPPSRPARPLRTGPVSIFVSRKEGKLYVRKGFDPLFSVPVTISRPDQPIGTHLFTAAEIKEDGASLRWIAVSMPPDPARQVDPRDQIRDRTGKVAAKGALRAPATEPSMVSPTTAAEAMDRIELTKETVERLSALMSIGASFIISDQGLGHETGRETDFIVLTPAQATPRPATRRRPVPSPARARSSVPYYWFR